MKFIEPMPKCLQVVFKTQEEMADAMCRFQLDLDMPETFPLGKFSIETIYTWFEDKYNFPYRYVSGFNFPIIRARQEIIIPVSDHSRLSKVETEILQEAEKRGCYYVISADPHTLLHEKIHALFYLDKTYQDLVMSVLKSSPVVDHYWEEIKKQMPIYGEHVKLDETNAYVACGDTYNQQNDTLGVLSRTLRGLFDKHLESYTNGGIK